MASKPGKPVGGCKTCGKAVKIASANKAIKRIRKTK